MSCISKIILFLFIILITYLYFNTVNVFKVTAGNIPNGTRIKFIHPRIKGRISDGVILNSIGSGIETFYRVRYTSQALSTYLTGPTQTEGNISEKSILPINDYGILKSVNILWDYYKENRSKYQSLLKPPKNRNIDDDDVNYRGNIDQVTESLTNFMKRVYDTAMDNEDESFLNPNDKQMLALDLIYDDCLDDGQKYEVIYSQDPELVDHWVSEIKPWLDKVKDISYAKYYKSSESKLDTELVISPRNRAVSTSLPPDSPTDIDSISLQELLRKNEEFDIDDIDKSLPQVGNDVTFIIPGRFYNSYDKGKIVNIDQKTGIYSIRTKDRVVEKTLNELKGGKKLNLVYSLI